jgi:hypothetical protein
MLARVAQMVPLEPLGGYIRSFCRCYTLSVHTRPKATRQLIERLKVLEEFRGSQLAVILFEKSVIDEIASKKGVGESREEFTLS